MEKERRNKGTRGSEGESLSPFFPSAGSGQALFHFFPYQLSPSSILHFPFSILLSYVLAHALAGIGLVAFGLRAGGWVLHPLAVAWHGLFVLGSLVLLGRSRRDAASPWPLVIPPVLALAAVGTVGSTGALGGATYAPYDPYETLDIFLALNVLAALGLTALALLYRWPRLLLAWATAHGLPLISQPAWWATLWRWGVVGPLLIVSALTLGAPLLYALAAGALGVRAPGSWRRWMAAGLVVGVGLVILAGLRHAAYLDPGLRPEATSEAWRAFWFEVPALIALGLFLMPLPLMAAQALLSMAREQRSGGAEEQRSGTTGEITAPHLRTGACPEPRRRTPLHPGSPAPMLRWGALSLLIWTSAAVAASVMQLAPNGMLPTAGTAQGWRGADHVVPDAWWPTIVWAGWLFAAARWLAVPMGLVALATVAQRMRSRLALPTFPSTLVWAGVGWLAATVWDFSPLAFPLTVAREQHTLMNAFLPLVGGVLLILAGRAFERRGGGAEAQRRTTHLRTGACPEPRRRAPLLLRTLARGATLGLLLGLIAWVVRAAWWYGQVLFAPLPAWAERWQYAPLPPVPASGLGLTAHLLVLGLGLLALVTTLRAWVTEQIDGRRMLRRLGRTVVLPLGVLFVVAGVGWRATAPAVVHTVPANGATDVPRDTVIRIDMGAEKEWAGLLLGGSGWGIHPRYADTGEYIQGTTTGWSNGFHFNPRGLLRPDAPVEVIVRRTGERPYTLRFTTAGTGSPMATPLPASLGPTGPGPRPTTTLLPDN